MTYTVTETLDSSQRTVRKTIALEEPIEAPREWNGQRPVMVKALLFTWSSRDGEPLKFASGVLHCFNLLKSGDLGAPVDRRVHRWKLGDWEWLGKIEEAERPS